MVYDLHRIFVQVARRLEMAPSISLRQVSESLGVERHTVEKAVKSATGVTFREFRRSILLKHAEGLLRDQPTRSIKEVAFVLGYRSQGSLSRFVRMATGSSAKELKIGKSEKLAS
jgi:AraC-like DNA-binding protein